MISTQKKKNSHDPLIMGGVQKSKLQNNGKTKSSNYIINGHHHPPYQIKSQMCYVLAYTDIMGHT